MFSLDPQSILVSVGLIGFAIIVFAESGFLFGFFLPGDSLLFTAGLLSANGLFPYPLVLSICIVCAILGDTLGYWSGHHFGPKLFSRDDSLIFRKSHVEKTRDFYERYGKKTIILSRFVPIVRTFAPIMAGVGNMDYRTFAAYNVIGGVAWSVLLTGSGFVIGHAIPQSKEYVSFIIIAIIFVSFIPVFRELLLERRRRKQSVEKSE